MKKQDVIAFFDRLAPTWDAEQVNRDAVISVILDNADVRAGQDVLDVACGTGVVFPHYLKRGVKSVTGIDISPEMSKIAAGKYADQPSVRVVCGDVETATFDRLFDRVVVYNAFPHFPDGKRLVARLAGLLKPGGRLTIAHGFSREMINAHHEGTAHHVSNGLMSAEELKMLFEPWFDVDVVISNNKMYQVAGAKH